jgi:serine/threonine protein kinase
MKRPRHVEHKEHYWRSCSPSLPTTEQYSTMTAGSSSPNDQEDDNDNTRRLGPPMTEQPFADLTLPSSSSSSSSWLSCFGSEFIHEIGTTGNPVLTRGGFGEISIALRKTTPSMPSHSSVPQWQLVAIKTMEQAIVVVVAGGPRTTTTTVPKLYRPIFHELCALRQLQSHPNIIPLWAVYSPPNIATNTTTTQSSFSSSLLSSSSSLSLVFPYCPVDLQLALEWRRRTFQPLFHLDFTTVLPTLARDILQAIHHCHSRHVLHRDVKPGNILVTPTGVLQLCDFGLSQPYTNKISTAVLEYERENGKHSTTTTMVASSSDNDDHALCTLNYRSPEALLGAPATHPAVDLYSVGTVLGEFAIGQPLFPGRNVLDQLSRVFDVLGTPSVTHWPNAKAMPDHGKLHFGTRLPQSWTVTTTTTTTTTTSTMPSASYSCSFPRLLECPPLAHCVASLIALDPNRRLSSRQALDHEWVQQLETTDTTTKDDADAAAVIRRWRRHCRRQIQQALIPDELRPPLSLSLLGCSKEKAAQQALTIASHRRRLLVTPVSSTQNTLSPWTWNGPNVGDESLTLDVLCQRFVAVHTP